VLLEQLRAAGVHSSGRRRSFGAGQDPAPEYLRKSHGSSNQEQDHLTRKQTPRSSRSRMRAQSAHIQVEVKKSASRQARLGAGAPRSCRVFPGAVDSREAELREENSAERGVGGAAGADLAEKQSASASSPRASERGEDARAGSRLDTTLHKPKLPGAKRRGEEGEGNQVWKTKRQAPQIKTRGDVQGASGWHNPRADTKRGRTGRRGVQQFSAPASRSCASHGAETISVGDLATRCRQGRESSSADETGQHGDDQSGAGQETAMIVVTEMATWQGGETRRSDPARDRPNTTSRVEARAPVSP